MQTPSTAPSGTDQPAQRPRDNSSNSATSAQFLYYTLALIAIIASVCLVSLCYRSVYFSSIFKCNKPRERNVEVIIETNAEFEAEPNYVDTDSCTPQNGDIIPSEITNSQKVYREDTHYVQDTESGCSYPEQTPIAVAACGRECTAGNVLARMIGVMVNVPAVSVVDNRSNLHIYNFSPYLLLSIMLFIYCGSRIPIRTSLHLADEINCIICSVLFFRNYII